jgi:hypothetical protein
VLLDHGVRPLVIVLYVPTLLVLLLVPPTHVPVPQLVVFLPVPQRVLEKKLLVLLVRIPVLPLALLELGTIPTLVKHVQQSPTLQRVLL